MQYLADKTPRQTLYPTEARARADVNRWLFWCAQHFHPAIGILNWENWIKGMTGQGGPDPAEVRRGEQLVIEFGACLMRASAVATGFAALQSPSPTSPSPRLSRPRSEPISR